MPLVVVNLKRVSPELKRTNELLERIAVALERLSPELTEEVESELQPLVIDDAEGEKETDESEGLGQLDPDYEEDQYS